MGRPPLPHTVAMLQKKIKSEINAQSERVALLSADSRGLSSNTPESGVNWTWFSDIQPIVRSPLVLNHVSKVAELHV
jgi:hypothetical protein